MRTHGLVSLSGIAVTAISIRQLTVSDPTVNSGDPYWLPTFTTNLSCFQTNHV